MNDAFFRPGKRRDAQTLVFFILTFGTIILLAGLAIDSGLLYLAKARLGRAVDGAALAAVGNFSRGRDNVAVIMRNFAVANFTDLGGGSNGGVAATTTGVQSTYTLPNGQTGYIYTYNFNDGTQDANTQYKRFVEVTLKTGAGNNVTSATCNARCPVHTYFINFAGNYFRDLKVSSSAIATRNPRLIIVVVDRSGSMLATGGGAYGLPQSITEFLDFFDTSSDYIGIVSFGSSARLEMPLTTNFIIAGTNVLYDAYKYDLSEGANVGVPGPDDEQNPASTPPSFPYDPNYYTTGIRRMKFGGTTAADEGIRLGMEQLEANPGFNDPDVVKYMVLFTDGAWNCSRTLTAAPGYTNTVTPPTGNGTTIQFLANAVGEATANGGAGPWNTNVAADTNLLPVPTLSPLPYVTNAIVQASAGYPALGYNHTNDYWQSVDNGGNEPLPNSTFNGSSVTANTQGAPGAISSTAFVVAGTGTSTGTNFYTHDLDVWLQPGSVGYLYHPAGAAFPSNYAGANPGIYVSDYTNPTKHIAVHVNSGDSFKLVVPGYLADGLLFDQLDMGYPQSGGFPRYKANNFVEPFMWYDDTTPLTTQSAITGYTITQGLNSLERQLMFRNYINLLTGFYVFRPDEPLATYTPGNPVGSQGIEPLVKDYSSIGAPRPYYGLGPYYPSAGYYGPFDLMGLEGGLSLSYPLIDPVSDPDLTHYGKARHLEYSISMLSPAAAPEWAGELFYHETGANGTLSDASASSTLMTSKSDWQTGAPAWLLNDFDVSGLTVTESAHNTTNLPTVNVWRPVTFNGSNMSVSGVTGCLPGVSVTGGFVTDGNGGHYYKNAMAWSGRVTHYYDFSKSTWLPVGDNHTGNIQALPMGNWKAQEYAWHARAQGVTIYTVGYGNLVYDAQQVLLAQMANATNTTGFSSTNGGANVPISYNPNQPIGQQFYATTTNEISNDFYAVGQAINAALTQ